MLAILHYRNLAIYCIHSQKFCTVLQQKLFGIRNLQSDGMQLITLTSTAGIAASTTPPSFDAAYVLNDGLIQVTVTKQSVRN